jgi:hypothetical protein
MRSWIIGIIIIGVLVAIGPTTALSTSDVNVTALTCTIKNTGDIVVDLRLNNSGLENRTVTIQPSGTEMDLLPNITYRKEIILANKVSILNISVDDGIEFQVNSPNCTTSGWSGSGSSGNPPGPTTPGNEPTSPTPELSPMVLTLAGILGLLLVSRTRKK